MRRGLEKDKSIPFIKHLMETYLTAKQEKSLDMASVSKAEYERRAGEGY